MRYGFFTTLAEPDNKRPYTQILRDLREQAVFCDEAGFETVWLAEHHFGPEGMGNIPNPVLIAADLGPRTRTVRFGMCAVILPWWHPIRLAEDLATLDHLLDGRLDVSVGRGVWPREGPNFHPKADPRDADANMALFRETLDVLRKCWTEEFFRHEGPSYTFPAPTTRWSHPMFPADPRWRDGDRVVRLNVVPRPLQQPHPPLWQVCSSASSIEFAARNAMGALLWQPPPRAIRHFGQMYARLRAEAEGRPVDARRHLGVLRQVYVAPTMEQAQREARDSASFVFLYNNPFRGLAMFMNPGEQPQPGMTMGYDFLVERGNVLVGPPDYVVERLGELREVAGVDYVLLDMALPYMSQGQILGSMELFATGVMPQLGVRRATGA
jgi:alkanesulfonate monooxygenase SsuD/methylene tetrahydromethanopterin reductase-like flavin-dependent oxidoreductase (luciferase family)